MQTRRFLEIVMIQEHHDNFSSQSAMAVRTDESSERGFVTEWTLVLSDDVDDSSR